jgi:hypothetical protein
MLYGEFISPATIKHTSVVTWHVRYFCPILSKPGLYWQVFLQDPNMKFYGKTSNGSRCDAWERTDRQTDRRTVGQTGGRMNMTKLTGAFRESANAPKNHNVWCAIQSLTCGKRNIYVRYCTEIGTECHWYKWQSTRPVETKTELVGSPDVNSIVIHTYIHTYAHCPGSVFQITRVP